jgi:hypothetical protein
MTTFAPGSLHEWANTYLLDMAFSNGAEPTPEVLDWARFEADNLGDRLAKTVEVYCSQELSLTWEDD